MCSQGVDRQRTWLEKQGGDREGPSPPGPMNFISWVGPGGTQYITKWALFTSLGMFFSNYNSCIGGFGPFETLGDSFLRGPPRPSLPTSRIIYPALTADHVVHAVRGARRRTASSTFLTPSHAVQHVSRRSLLVPSMNESMRPFLHAMRYSITSGVYP